MTNPWPPHEQPMHGRWKVIGLQFCGSITPQSDVRPGGNQPADLQNDYLNEYAYVREVIDLQIRGSITPQSDVRPGGNRFCRFRWPTHDQPMTNPWPTHDQPMSSPRQGPTLVGHDFFHESPLRFLAERCSSPADCTNTYGCGAKPWARWNDCAASFNCGRASRHLLQASGIASVTAFHKHM